jgi:hypothetical protein
LAPKRTVSDTLGRTNLRASFRWGRMGQQYEMPQTGHLVLVLGRLEAACWLPSLRLQCSSVGRGEQGSGQHHVWIGPGVQEAVQQLDVPPDMTLLCSVHCALLCAMCTALCNVHCTAVVLSVAYRKDTLFQIRVKTACTLSLKASSSVHCAHCAPGAGDV